MSRDEKEANTLAAIATVIVLAIALYFIFPGFLAQISVNEEKERNHGPNMYEVQR